jgi:hypothetical protein
VNICTVPHMYTTNIVSLPAFAAVGACVPHAAPPPATYAQQLHARSLCLLPSGVILSCTSLATAVFQTNTTSRQSCHRARLVRSRIYDSNWRAIGSSSRKSAGSHIHTIDITFYLRSLFYPSPVFPFNGVGIRSQVQSLPSI